MKKELLEKIISNHFILPEKYNLGDFTDELMGNLGSTVRWKRDFSYIILSAWILRLQNSITYSNKQLIELGEIVKSNINIQLNSLKESDAIFLRAYSILILNDLTQIHKKYPYLAEEEVINRLNLALWYIDQENDLRGFISSEKGWAHGIAHIADTFMILGADKYIKNKHLNQILSAISERIRKPTSIVFVHSEEERLARATMKIFSSKLLSFPDINIFIDKLTVPYSLKKSGKFVWENFDRNPWRYVLTGNEEELFAYRNLQNFIRSLYFQWRRLELPGEKKLHIESKLEAAMNYIELGFYNKDNGFFIP